jgi:hypothetical protein
MANESMRKRLIDAAKKKMSELDLSLKLQKIISLTASS